MRLRPGEAVLHPQERFTVESTATWVELVGYDRGSRRASAIGVQHPSGEIVVADLACLE